MRTGRPIAPLSLGVEERETLEGWARRPKSAQALAQRARIVLECASSSPNTAVADKLGVTYQTVGKWRQRFLERRLAGLLDEPRPGAPRQVGDAQIERVVRMTLERAPADATHWSTRAMAKRCGLSQSMVSRIWRAFALQPHRVEGFKLSKDPLFIEKVRDIVGLYLNPPDRARWCCASTRRARSRPSIAVSRCCRCAPARLSGVLPTICVTALPTCSPRSTSRRAVIGQFHRRHRAVEFRQFLETIDHQVPRRCALHLIIDNYATHKTPAIKRWLLRHPRFHLHFTPTGASWLNLVERWFAGLTEKQLRRGVHRSTRELQDAIRHYLELNNRHPKPFIWTKTADQILESVARFCKRTSDSGH